MDVLVEIIGWLGAFFIVSSFFLNARHILTAKSPVYLWMNLIGAMCIVINSLYVHAFPQMTINIFWFFIAAHGLWAMKKLN